MSFQPTISVTAVPRDSTSFTFLDTTGTYPAAPNGYGSTNAPANQSAITIVWASVTPYGEGNINAASMTGDLADGEVAAAPVPDGVNMMNAFFGILQAITGNVSVSSSRLTLTTTDGGIAAKLDGVSMLGIDTTFPVPILSVTTVSGTTTITLAAPMPGSASTYANLYTYWTASQRVLVMNCAQCKIVNQIAELPLDANRDYDSNGILNLVMMKINAYTSFDCGNYSKAHEAARLICNSQPIIPSNCPSCQ